MTSQFALKTSVLMATLVSLLTLSACGAPPKRDAYTGADQVGEFSAAQLVGNWKIIVLNPVGDENKSSVSQTYNDDGSWVSKVIPPKDQADDFGPMEFRGTGIWQVNGDAMFTKMNSIEETSGNKLGGLVKSIMSLFMSKMTGTVNAYEISANRAIFVNEETGQATLLERI